MPPDYVALPPDVAPLSDSAAAGDPPTLPKSVPLRPPSFQIPDPFAPLRRARQSMGTDGDDSSESEYDDEATISDEKVMLMRGGDAPAHLDENGQDWPDRTQARSTRRRFILGAIVAIPLCFLFSGLIVSNIISPPTGLHTFKGQGLKKITREHLENGTFYPDSVELAWLAEAGDGVYSKRTETGSIMLFDVYKNESRILVDGNKIRDADGTKLEWSRFRVSADLQFILFDTEWTKQWRHSTYANFWIHNVSASTTKRLRGPSYPPRTSFASFSPKNHHIAYVHSNDLYVLESPPASGQRNDAIRITRDGSATTFNGVPDWVYEEEVFSSDVTTWWSPSGSKLAFLSFDEEQVPEYEFPVYNSDWFVGGADTYPSHTIMRYPKAGYPNPKVRLRVFDLERFLTDRTSEWSDEEGVLRATKELVLDNPFPEDDVIISEVEWIGADELMVKATNRIATIERVALFNFDRNLDDGQKSVVVGKVVRSVDFDKLDGGWAEPGSNIVGIASTVLLHSQANDSESSASIPSYPPGYLDIVPSPSGFNHLAYFSPADSKEPVFLTEGDWEIDGSVQMVDVQRGLVYFIAANPSIERHLFSVPLPTSLAQLSDLKAGKTELPAPTPLTDTSERGRWSVSFSPFGGIYQLDYEGPGIPYQKLVKVEDPAYTHILTDNAALRSIDSKFQHAEISYPTVAIEPKFEMTEGSSARQKEITLDTMELRPPMMDVSGRTKYPVLFQVYGGPNSQTVTTKYQRDWQHYLCSALGYVIVRVDPRGTGFRGRKHRVLVKNRLGEVERSDVIATARQWADLPYVDEKRIAIWGWSYGGFLTSKVIEANSSVFQLGMAVAPVTDWRYYDSVYTERYMSTPQLNPGGYQNSSISQMDGFKHAHFALAHGSGDDNVHFQNTAALLDKFTVARVRGFEFRQFTDADHSMGLRGAYWELMAWLESVLVDNFGEGGRTKAKWKLKAEQSEHD
ncbi:S9 family peptidase [Sporobolomyces koalae]|uniref:S9 family peptidase n=1 Tax=Sporobolomyces koalae TaxID=500713 RepID=UPI00317D36CC